MSSALRSEASSAMAAAICSGFMCCGDLRRDGALDVVSDTVRNEISDRLPAATRRRIMVEEMPIGGIRKKWAWSPPGRPARACTTAARAVPRRLAMAGVASSRTRSARCQLDRPAAMSPPKIKNSSVSGVSAFSQLQGIDRVRRSVAAQLQLRHLEAVIVLHGEPTELEAMLGARARPRLACAGGLRPGSASRGRARADGTPPGRTRGDRDVAD